MKKKDPGPGAYSNLIIIKLPARKEQVSSEDYILNYEQLPTTNKLLDDIKGVFLNTGNPPAFIQHDTDNSPKPMQAGREIKGSIEEGLSFKKKEPGQTPQATGFIKFQCRQNKKIFVERFLREVNKELGLFITPIDDVIDILFSKRIVPASKKIYMDCGNPRFAYIIKLLQIYFISFNIRNIGRSELFYNEHNTKITEYALYKAWSRTMYDPADVVIIDAILKKVEQICTDI